MGCCSGRPFENRNAEAFQSMKIGYSSKAYFTSDTYSIQKITDEDILTLTKARDNFDVSTIVRKLDDDKEINDKIDLNHPWAEPPKTIGSVACAYLVILFVRDEELEGQLKHEEVKKIMQFTNIAILEGIISKIRNNLSSSYTDKRELTILLLMFLVEDNAVMRDHLKKENLFAELMPFLDKKSQDKANKLGLRMATLQFMREIFKRDPIFEEEFCKIGGMENIVEFLESNELSIIFEGINSLDELSYADEHGSKRNPKILKVFEEYSVITKLEEVQNKVERQLAEGGNSQEDGMRKNIKTYTTYLLDDFKKRNELKI